jgi:aryl-alcohol dehydrogenase-like predicted oxidoreductase/NAD-dependent dihydropyrimidine dehydrogenase PreA subunit
LRKVDIGATGITVTELCHGTLILGPLQANLTPEQGAKTIRKSYDLGVSFYDTAQGYRTYHHLALGLEGIPENRVAIASKSHAASRDQMRADVEECLKELGRSYVDIFELHLVSSEQNLRDRHGALECLVEMRRQGYVRAIGASTHTVAGVNAINGEPSFDVVFPVLNQRGLGIIDGNLAQMLEALAETKRLNKFVYAMKPLGGGHLSTQPQEAFNYLRRLPVCDAVAAGMKDAAEVEMNIAIFEDRPILADLATRVSSVQRRLIIYDRCVSCGLCIEECDQKALTMGETKAQVDQTRCILCGYCAAVCPEYVIRVV